MLRKSGRKKKEKRKKKKKNRLLVERRKHASTGGLLLLKIYVLIFIFVLVLCASFRGRSHRGHSDAQSGEPSKWTKPRGKSRWLSVAQNLTPEAETPMPRNDIIAPPSCGGATCPMLAWVISGLALIPSAFITASASLPASWPKSLRVSDEEWTS